MAIILWDFDGTLVHSNHLWSSSVYRSLRETDKNTCVAFNDIRKCMASGFTWHTPNEDYSSLTNEKWWDFMNNKILKDYISLGINESIAKEASQKVRSIIKEVSNYELYPDSVETLNAAIKKGHKNVILSNNYPDLIDVIKALNLDRYSDNFIVSAVVGYDKPRPEIFEIAKNLYPNDTEFIMIGDSVNADIIGGNNSGMKTILVHNGQNRNADYCFDNLKSILEVI
ncbi:MAG: HAD family hydrolase [Eubacterium sp.]|nr:HAD family hydrolase [Eubacterium sp.]